MSGKDSGSKTFGGSTNGLRGRSYSTCIPYADFMTEDERIKAVKELEIEKLNATKLSSIPGSKSHLLTLLKTIPEVRIGLVGAPYDSEM